MTLGIDPEYVYQSNSRTNLPDGAIVLSGSDGCALECAKKSLELAGFTQINHIILSDHGFEKGSTEVTPESIENVIDQAKKYL